MASKMITQYAGVYCWLLEQEHCLVPGDATLSYSTPDTTTTSFTSNLSRWTRAHPLEAPCPPLPAPHRYHTQTSLSSSCCDQRAPCFHWHQICQAAQQGEEDMCCGCGKGCVPASQDYTVLTSLEVSHTKVHVCVEMVSLGHLKDQTMDKASLKSRKC